VNLTFQGVIKLRLLLRISDRPLLWAEAQVLFDAHPRPTGENLHRQPRIDLHRLMESQGIFMLSALFREFLAVACERRLSLIPL
jgi:hypothetical protein